MNQSTKQLKKVLQIIFKGNEDKRTKPANQEEIEIFTQTAIQKGIPLEVINQLIGFYKISNGFPGLDGFDFHKCNDPIIFEWWDKHKELWLGQRDFYVLRWSQEKDKFCLGDASTVSFSDADEYETLIELLEGAYKEFNPE